MKILVYEKHGSANDSKLSTFPQDIKTERYYSH